MPPLDAPDASTLHTPIKNETDPASTQASAATVASEIQYVHALDSTSMNAPGQPHEVDLDKFFSPTDDEEVIDKLFAQAQVSAGDELEADSTVVQASKAFGRWFTVSDLEASSRPNSARDKRPERKVELAENRLESSSGGGAFDFGSFAKQIEAQGAALPPLPNEASLHHRLPAVHQRKPTTAARGPCSSGSLQPPQGGSAEGSRILSLLKKSPQAPSSSTPTPSLAMDPLLSMQHQNPPAHPSSLPPYGLGAPATNPMVSMSYNPAGAYASHVNAPPPPAAAASAPPIPGSSAGLERWFGSNIHTIPQEALPQLPKGAVRSLSEIEGFYGHK